MSIWDKIQNIWVWLNTQTDKLIEAVSNIEVLLQNIDAVTFDLSDSTSIINKLFGLLRYLLGDTFYIAFIGSVYAAALFMLYKLFMRLWEAIRSGLKIDLGSIVTK